MTTAQCRLIQGEELLGQQQCRFESGWLHKEPEQMLTLSSGSINLTKNSDRFRMNLFQTDSDATFYTAIITIAITIISDVVKRNWNRRAKELNEILDLNAKLEQKNPRVQALAELHEARFVIQAETVEEYKKNLYIMSGAPVRKVWLFYAFKAITLIIKTIFTASSFLAFKVILDAMLQIGLSVPASLATSALLLFISMTWAIRLGRNITLPRGKYRARFRDSSNDPNYKEFNVKVPEDTLSFAHYAFIGIPELKDLNKIRIYKLVSSSNSTEPVSYKHSYTRDMTMLEREWMSKLNKLGGPLRKSIFYVPLVEEASGLTYSAYYLIEK